MATHRDGGGGGGGVAACPRDLIAEVLAKVASDSPTPLRDLINLRRSCKMLYEASKSPMVGRRMAVEKEGMLSWWDREKFLDLIRSCAESGNLEACFVLGLDEFYNKRRKAEGLGRLREAAAGGHRAAAYAAGMLLFHGPKTRGLGVELLEDLAGNADGGGSGGGGGNSVDGVIGAWRREAANGVRAITWKRWRRPLKRSEEGPPCSDRRCGAAVAAEKGGGGGGGGGGGEWWWERERRFCSKECRWRLEYYKFIECI